LTGGLSQPQTTRTTPTRLPRPRTDLPFFPGLLCVLRRQRFTGGLSQPQTTRTTPTRRSGPRTELLFFPGLLRVLRRQRFTRGPSPPQTTRTTPTRCGGPRTELLFFPGLLRILRRQRLTGGLSQPQTTRTTPTRRSGPRTDLRFSPVFCVFRVVSGGLEVSAHHRPRGPLRPDAADHERTCVSPRSSACSASSVVVPPTRPTASQHFVLPFCPVVVYLDKRSNAKEANVSQEFLFSEETHSIIGACFEVYHDKGCGFLEPVYQECLEIELGFQGIPFVPLKPLRLSYRGRTLRHAYEPDFVCFGQIIVEIKAVKELCDEHRAQVLNYLKAAALQVGLLVNFGHYPKAEVERIVATTGRYAPRDCS
jgi:GxxExxY protein